MDREASMTLSKNDLQPEGINFEDRCLHKIADQ